MKDSVAFRHMLLGVFACSPLGLVACRGESTKPADAVAVAPVAPSTPVATTAPAASPTAPPTVDGFAPTTRRPMETEGSCPPGSDLVCLDRRKVTARAGSATQENCPQSAEEAGLDLRQRTPGSVVLRAAETRAAQKTSPAGTTVCCYAWQSNCAGRWLLDAHGAPSVAELVVGDAWRGDASTLVMPSHEAIARAWSEDALLEHASIASFARATLELMAVGAPARLIEQAQLASLDEIRHTRGCLEIARAYGATTEPGPLQSSPPRAPVLDRLANDTLIEGCIGETIAALEATRAAASAPIEFAATLESIARDERSHAALAWSTLGWIISQRGASLARALVERAVAFEEAQRAAPTADLEVAAPGRLTTREKLAARADAWRDIIHPALRQLTHDAPHASLETDARA